MTTEKEVLESCSVEANVVKLPNVVLDRNLYVKVKKQLELIGGAWKGGKTQGFVFASNPAHLLMGVINGGNLKKEYQFFATPPELGRYLIELANVKPHHIVLEPEAGQGAIIKLLNEIEIVPDCYELMDVNRQILRSSGLKYRLMGDDFLKGTREIKYDRIVANPPFSGNQDIAHVMEMYEVLAPKGRMVSVMSNSWVHGERSAQVNFKNWLYGRVNAGMAQVENINNGTFKASGTMVGAKIVIIDKA